MSFNGICLTFKKNYSAYNERKEQEPGQNNNNKKKNKQGAPNDNLGKGWHWLKQVVTVVETERPEIRFPPRPKCSISKTKGREGTSAVILAGQSINVI